METKIIDIEVVIVAALGTVEALLRYRSALGEDSVSADHARDLSSAIWDMNRSMERMGKITADYGNTYPRAVSTPLDVSIKRIAALRLKHRELLEMAHKITHAGGVECSPEIEQEANKLMKELFPA